MDKNDFVQKKVAGTEFTYDRDQYNIKVKVVDVLFYDPSHMVEIFVNVEGWYETWEQATWVRKDIETDKDWSFMNFVEVDIKTKIARILQYINVYEDEIFILLSNKKAK